MKYNKYNVYYADNAERWSSRIEIIIKNHHGGTNKSLIIKKCGKIVLYNSTEVFSSWIKL